jgi:hypothetical protein
VREIRMLRAMRRVLETQLRKLLTGHEDGNVGYRHGVSFGLTRPHSTLPGLRYIEMFCFKETSEAAPNTPLAHAEFAPACKRA